MIIKILSAKSKKAVGLLAILASLGSFIADVLEPLAPFSKYIFILAILLLIIFRLLNFYKKGIYEKFSFLIIFFWLVAIMSGAVYFAKQNSFKNGLFANLFPKIEEVQSDFGIIEKDLTDIKTTTEEIKKETKDITKKLDDIEQKIDGVNVEENIKKIDYSLMFGGEGSVSINLQPMETVREFFYSTDDKNYISLGFSESIDPRTGLYWPHSQISFQEYKFVKRTFYVKYLDFNNNPKGPFKIELDLKDEFLKSEKKWIKRSKWVSWDLRDRYYNYSLRGVLTYRCAIKIMKIQIDQGKVNTINFPSCENEFKERRKNAYWTAESDFEGMTLFKGARFLKPEVWGADYKYAIPVPNTKYIIFNNHSPEYEEALKKWTYIYHPEMKNIRIQIIYYDDESSIFRSFDNPMLN